jgi:hypothetical protein
MQGGSRACGCHLMLLRTMFIECGALAWLLIECAAAPLHLVPLQVRETWQLQAYCLAQLAASVLCDPPCADTAHSSSSSSGGCEAGMSPGQLLDAAAARTLQLLLTPQLWKAELGGCCCCLPDWLTD